MGARGDPRSRTRVTVGASVDVVERRARLTLVGVALASALTACAAAPHAGPREAPPTSPDTPSATSPPPTPATPTPQASPAATGPSPSPGAHSTAPAPPVQGTVPPSWLGTRILPRTADGFGEIRPTPGLMRVRRWNTTDTIAELPGNGFRALVTDPAPAQVIARSTWQPGCPVGRNDLAWIRMSYWGFDDTRHSGEMLVNGSVAEDVVAVFRKLYTARFPIESMGISRLEDLDAPPTGDGNVTGAFSCRPIRGGKEYSQHAYGLAVDLNPFQNPYHRGDVVLPELASAYLNRDWVRPGMITTDGPAVRAFASIAWGWGGSWSTLKDYQHFSLTGR